MPVVFREAGFRFHFFSNEGDPREPMNVHVSSPHGDAKLWLYPEVSFAYSRGYSARDERFISATAETRRAEIEGRWNEFFSSGN